MNTLRASGSSESPASTSREAIDNSPPDFIEDFADREDLDVLVADQPSHEEITDIGADTVDSSDDDSSTGEAPDQEHWDFELPQDPFDCDSGWKTDALSIDSDDEVFVQQPGRKATGSTNEPEEWFPYNDKGMFATDLLFNSPRMKFSRAQQKAVLSWGKQLGAENVPSHSKFLEMQKDLLDRLGDPTSRQQSSRGNDMSNPITRPDMVFYPEDGEGRLGEVWHGNKMLRDILDALLSPTLRHDKKIYWVDELVKRAGGQWFIPKRWITRQGYPYAVGFHAHPSENGLVVDSTTLVTVPVATFVLGLDEILNESSGIYPLAHNEFHVRFIATSPHATPLEIMQGIQSSIEQTFKDPIIAMDCQENEEVLLRPYGLFFPGDNPMQAELSSGCGLAANHSCRTCKAGGTREFKQSNEGFETLFKAGEERNCKETAKQTVEQLMTALQPNVVTSLTDAVRKSGVKDAMAQPIIDNLVKLGQDLRKASPDRAAHSPDEVLSILADELAKAHQQGGVLNPLVNMGGTWIFLRKSRLLTDDLISGVKIHKDTPTEILHTILLGVVKYFWGQTVWHLEKTKQLAAFQVRLNSVAADGLNIPPIHADYMCQYRQGLIGKHFKTLSQIMAFTVYDLVPREVLDTWLIIGRLTVLLWHTDIDDVESYLSELEKCINDFLNVTCQCSPSILISKPKFHFLVHLPFYIRRFGPALLFSTERFESYHAVFRGASIFSNHLAPSWDIAWAFARMDRVKHIVTGGLWKDSKTDKWVRASPKVLHFIRDHPEHAALIGLPRAAAAKALLKWKDTCTYQSTPRQDLFAMDAEFVAAKALITRTGDTVSCGSFVAVRAEGTSLCAQICEIIKRDTSPHTGASDIVTLAFVCVELLDFGETRHVILDMPTVSRRAHSTVLTPDDIICAVNLQHDCPHGHCTLDKPKDLYQEREKIIRQRMTVSHTDNIHYILNIQSLHNHQSLAQLIPHHLRGYSYHVPDEVQLRHQAAASIRQKHKDLTQAKEDLLVAEILDHAEGGNTGHASGTDLLQSLQNDSDIIDVLHGVLQRAGTLTDLEPPASHQDAALLPTVRATPIFSAAIKSKVKGKQKAVVPPPLSKLLLRFSVKLSKPTLQDFTSASAEVQAPKVSQPGPSRKRKQRDAEHDPPDGITDGAVDGGATLGPPRKRRGQAHATESLRLTNETMLLTNNLFPAVNNQSLNSSIMTFADGLASSDGPEIEDESATGGQNADIDNFSHSDSAGILSRGHSESRQSSLARSTFSSPGPGNFPSVLGRRQRDDQQFLSSRAKVHIRDFAANKCAEYELSDTDRNIIMNDSELSTHELLVVFMCKLARNKTAAQDDNLATYLKSASFKENVAVKLKTMLLDPNISSYKNGNLERVMRHIRINPGTVYRIPVEVRDLVTSNAFATPISKVLTNFRSLIKHKLSTHWVAKSDIYTLVKDLRPNGGYESSDEIWGRWAWVHLMFADFSDKIKEPDSKYGEKDFWDWLDALLAAHREKFSDISDDRERTVKVNRLKFPPKIKPKTGRLPSWQKAVSKAILEMESYTQDDLAEGPRANEDDDEQDVEVGGDSEFGVVASNS
ncbi:hypothetical protein HWV62_34048 [Athelia sp. TMB]|nr:hypothetical protein HWV62_34048 [Athelia sp. TMB]